MGYRFARNPIIEEYYLNNFLINKRYKATMLSIKSQIGKLFESGMALLVGLVVGISFSFGYLITGLTLLVSLLIMYPFLRKSLK